MVAMAISMLITLAAIAALVVARRGFDTVDSASQMRDNMRFTSDLIQRLGAQTGYKDVQYLPSDPNTAATTATASVGGFNNALYATISNTNTVLQKPGQGGLNGSDILILRMQGNTDESVIDCSGRAVDGPTFKDERSVSVIHLDDSQGELSLMCASLTRTPTNSLSLENQPIIQGVENFQVLYGVDTDNDSVADRFLRADQITTQANWRLVRSLRIGMVLRGPINSQQEKVEQKLYPFGLAKESASGAEGSALSSIDDTGSEMVIKPDEDPSKDKHQGRLRQTVTFTVHLRNDQNL